MRRIGLVVAVLVSPVVAAPAAQGGVPHPKPVAVTHVRTVRLITGDEVRVMTRADGTTVSTLVAGPHAGAPVARWGTGTGSYLMPRTPAAVRSKLDVSLFDVSRLARLHGPTVPVVVTLRQDATHRARRAVGNALDLLRTPSGTIHGAYPVGFNGIDARDLQAVRSIRLAGSSRPSRTAGPSHDLTVQVRTGSGRPVPGAVLFIENVDDSDRYLATPRTDDDGNVTVGVPEGNYGVLAWTFGKLVVAPEIAVTGDSIMALDLANATVRPHVSLPGHRVVETVLSVGRTAETGFSFPLVFSGPRFFMRVQPAGADVPHGSLHTGVSAKLVPVGGGPARTSQRLAVTADVSQGVPDELTYAHHRRDFARVVQRFFGNGPAGPRQTFLDASAPYVDLWTGQEYDTPMPGRRVVLLQASRSAYYQQTALPQAAPGSDNLTQLVALRRYRVPGRTHRVTFAHGPVGPGLETSSAYSGVARRADHLYGYLPLFSGAGSAMVSWVAGPDGHWTLQQGGHLLGRGRHQVFFDAAVPSGRRTYLLTAVSHPSAPGWELSTRVADVWTFHSAASAAHPPVLTPSYVPPSTMSGFVRPGRTGFGLSFSTPPRDHRIARATVELSTDGGRHWRPARVARTGAATFRVRYVSPVAHGPHRYMTVRVTGRDRHGNSVRETARNVYRLP